jgi:dienelactone hydrolase
MASKKMKDWKTRCRALRKKLHDVLGDFGTRGDPRPRIGKFVPIRDKYLLKTIPYQIERGYLEKDLWKPKDTDSFKTFSVEYPGLEGTTVYATLRVPKHLQGEAPAVLCLHGHGRGLWLGKEHTDDFACRLAEEGFITLAPDALPFGLRRVKSDLYDTWELDADGFLFWGERLWSNYFWSQGRTLMGAQIWEMRRALDVLQLLPEVDRNRIASVGASQGGVHTDWLMSMDERVKVGCAGASLLTYRAMSERRLVHALYSIIPHILEVADIPEVMSMIAPRALFLFDGRHDPHFPIDCQMEIHKVLRRNYERFGELDALKTYTIEGGHNDAGIMANIQPVITFLKKHL